MQQVVARGSCHSNEGLKLEEMALRAQDAKLLLRGGLGPHQNATLMLTDFPVVLLQPLFRCISIEQAKQYILQKHNCTSLKECTATNITTSVCC